MASPPPPYANVTGISRAVMKDSPQESFANYDGNARAGELVVNLDVDPPTLYIGNALGNLNEVTGGNGGSYGNSNVAAYLPNYTGNLSAANISVTGNIIPSANNTYNLGNNTNRFNNLYLTGNTIFLGSAILSSNASAVTFAIPGGGNVVLQGNANTTLGNIVSVNLDGNSGNVLSGAGTWIAAGGGGNASLPLANGNSNINIATANGAITLTSAGNTWTVGTDGTLTAPNNSNIYPAGNNFNVFTPPAGSVQFYSDNGNYSWSLDGFGVMNLPFASAMSNTALVYSPGNLRLDVGANNFMFTDTGTVVFPTITVDLHNGGNQAAQTLQFGDDTQQAVITGPTPAANVNAQRLIIQGQRGNGTGEGGDVYLWGGDANTNGGDIKIYAGDADSGTGYGGYVNIDAGNGPDSGGQLSLSGGSSSNGQGGQVTIAPGSSANANGAPLNLYGGQASGDGGNVVITAGYGQANGGQVNITGGISALGLANYGNVVINAGASTWTFDNAGNLVLAGGNSVIQSIANSSLDPTNPNVSTMTLTPDANYNSQVLVLDPTAPGHIHLRAFASSNIDEPSANIFLGGEDTAFEITSGPNNVARIHSGNLTWTFSNSSGASVIDLPGESYIRSNQDTVNIQSVDANNIGRGIYIGTNGALYFWDGNSQSVSIQQDNTNANITAVGNASITSNVYTWTFGTDGNLTLPGNLVSSGASPAPIISGFSSISSLKAVTTPQPLASLTATSGARAFINDANLVAAGNFGANVSNGGANTVPVWSDGTNWYIG